jgi:hypothetical protein
MAVVAGSGPALLGNQTLSAGNVDQFTLAIDPDTINEEIVFATFLSSDTFTIVRARAGTSGIVHSGGAKVRHVLTGNDLDYFASGVDGAVTPTGTQTLTNKTLTTPVIASISNSGTITVPTGTHTLVGRTTTDTLTNKTLTSPAINTATVTSAILVSPQERTTVSATAATGTVNFDALTQGVLYYTTNASANWTLNVRGNSTAALSNIMTTGDSITVAFAVTQGTTAYLQAGLTIDGTAVSPKWQGGIPPSAGNPSGIDVYTFTIIKMSSGIFTVLGSQTRFAT